MSDSLETRPAAQLLVYVEKQLNRFATNLERALEEGDVEAVHDLRVASRRLHEPLGLMRERLGSKSVCRARRDLRTLRDAFRKVRDLDVIQISLCESSPPALDAETLAQLEGMLTRRRERAMNSARKKCARLAADRTIRRVDSLAAEFARADGADVGAALGALFERRAARLRTTDPRDPSVSDLHDARIRVKRLRYTTELMQKVGLPADEALLRELTELQELLGHWNDQIVAAQRIARLACRRRVISGQALWAAQLLEFASLRARAAEADRGRILDRWRALDGLLRRTSGPSEATPEDHPRRDTVAGAP